MDQSNDGPLSTRGQTFPEKGEGYFIQETNKRFWSTRLGQTLSWDLGLPVKV